MDRIIDIEAYPVNLVLSKLLKDKTTKQNIIFGTDKYEYNGKNVLPTDQITTKMLLSKGRIEIQPRVSKTIEEQSERTKEKAEVFTPSWICNKMNNHCDEEWFGYSNVFNTEIDKNWRIKNKIHFPKDKTWQDYVESKRLEITCGEAPYIVSRYDTSSGASIPLKRRIGILDRKIRVINENAASESEWLEWVYKAYQSVYGFEYQGDNLLIARINLLVTFVEYLKEQWNRDATISELRHITNIITWNIWQMDGFTLAIPFKEPYEEKEQLDLFEVANESDNYNCRIYDWKANRSVEYKRIREKAR